MVKLLKENKELKGKVTELSHDLAMWRSGRSADASQLEKLTKERDSLLNEKASALLLLDATADPG